MAASADGSARGAHWRRYLGVYLAVILTALATVAVTALLVNIFEHKQEARQPFYRVVALDENTDDPAVWGKNFPMQYARATAAAKRCRGRRRRPIPDRSWRSRASRRIRA
jgi:nitrite reductase (cytochrome c-552)